jgi:hypothetical protein
LFLFYLPDKNIFQLFTLGYACARTIVANLLLTLNNTIMLVFLFLVVLPVLIVIMQSVLLPENAVSFLRSRKKWITVVNFILLTTAVIASNFVRIPLLCNTIRSPFYCWLANLLFCFFCIVSLCVVVLAVSVIVEIIRGHIRLTNDDYTNR